MSEAYHTPEEATRVHTFKRSQVWVTDDYYLSCLQVSARALASNGFTDVAVASDGTFLVGKDSTGPVLAIVEAVEAEDYDLAAADADEGLCWDEALTLMLATARFSAYAGIEPSSIRRDLIITCTDGERARVHHNRGVVDEAIVSRVAPQMTAALADGHMDGLSLEMVVLPQVNELSAYEMSCRKVAEDALVMAGLRLEGQFDDAGLAFAHDGDEVVVVFVQPVSPDCCEGVSEVIDAIKAGPTMAAANSLVAFYAERYGMDAKDIRMDLVIVGIGGERERVTHVVDALGDAIVHDGIAPTARPASRHRHL